MIHPLVILNTGSTGVSTFFLVRVSFLFPHMKLEKQLELLSTLEKILKRLIQKTQSVYQFIYIFIYLFVWWTMTLTYCNQFEVTTWPSHIITIFSGFITKGAAISLYPSIHLPGYIHL